MVSRVLQRTVPPFAIFAFTNFLNTTQLVLLYRFGLGARWVLSAPVFVSFPLLYSVVVIGN